VIILSFQSQTLLSYGHQVALHTEDYDKAERLLLQALRFQPGNSDGMQVLMRARESERECVWERERKREREKERGRGREGGVRKE
jgi:hypothetical protein